MQALGWYPSQVRETETARLPGHSCCLGLGSCCFPPASPPGRLHLTTANSHWRSLSTEAPWGPTRPTFHFPPAKEPGKQGPAACSRSESGGHPQPCLPEVRDFSFQLQVKAEQNKLSPFQSIITVTLSPSCHLLLHQNPHLAKLEGKRGCLNLEVTVLAREGQTRELSGAWRGREVAWNRLRAPCENRAAKVSSGQQQCQTPATQHCISSWLYLQGTQPILFFFFSRSMVDRQCVLVSGIQQRDSVV